MSTPNAETATAAATARRPSEGHATATAFGGEGAARGDAVSAEQPEVGPVGEEVDDDHRQHAADDGARQAPARVAHLAGDPEGLLPAAEGEERGHERGEDGGHHTRAGGDRRRGLRVGRGERGEDGDGQQRQHLGDRGGVLDAGADADPDDIGGGEADDERPRDREERGALGGPPPTATPRLMAQTMAMMAIGSGLDGGGVAEDVEEGRQGAVRVAEDGVVRAAAMVEAAQLGAGQRTAEDDGTGERPREERERVATDEVRDLRRGEEDPHADHGADDDAEGIGDAEHARGLVRVGQGSASVREEGPGGAASVQGDLERRACGFPRILGVSREDGARQRSVPIEHVRHRPVARAHGVHGDLADVGLGVRLLLVRRPRHHDFELARMGARAAARHTTKVVADGRAELT